MTRGRLLLAVAPILASLALAQISCDTGGEPPETLDAATGDVAILDAPVGDVSIGDSGLSETSSSDAPDQEDVVVEAGPCGDLGEVCCAGSTCTTEGTACNAIGRCAQCGAPGNVCCTLNICAEGGCCVGNVCVGQASICADTDGAVCTNGACGGCGGSGQVCCGSAGNVCTAPQTLCASDAGSGMCGTCGAAAYPCCAGSSCDGGALVCTGGACVPS